MGCVAGPPPACDDGIACTVDSCNEAAKQCDHVANNALCDNNIACDGVEFCNAILGCLSMGAPSCDDGVMCTDDFCDLAADACAHVPNDGSCSDGLFCNGSESCDPLLGAPGSGCLAGTPPSCNDSIGCTVDTCDEANKACKHTPSNAACSDGVFCNGAETCDALLGCVAGSPVNCNDNLSCTADACDEANKTCTHTPTNAVCDNGLYCDGVETCSVNGPAPTGCVDGPPPPCPSDNIACTADACDEPSQSCKHTPDNTLCPQGQFCVIAQNGCTPGTPCNTSAQCQDGDLCNGVEACVNGICQAGMPIDCDDGIACTTDACNPVNGQCSHAPSDLACSDGLACNGAEVCDPMMGCVSGAPVNCSDGVACTADACSEPDGTCSHIPVNFLCSDGKLCNGAEVCDPVLGCKPGAPFVCPSDGIACTEEVCDPVLNACKKILHNEQCGCGETCDPSLGCGNFCTVKTCQGKVYQCGDCLDNDGDCKIDSEDDQCLGPCDNTENSFYGGIPGQNNSPCKSDCYFDADTGSGNDDCYWSHKCDPLEVAPNYPPEGSQCAYNPNANIPGTGSTCAQLFVSQSAVCTGYCGPLTPNGCDCFGCCAIPGAPTTVWLGSENPAGTGSCNINTLSDPTKCKPCTQVTACLNTCEHCEICVGKPTLPPDCSSQQCPVGSAPCGQPGQLSCPDNQTCITGCCQTNPG